jgi:phosphotransferase system enzyme I (PtsI)
MGSVCLLRQELELPEGNISLDKEAIEEELERLRQAISATREHFLQLKERITQQMGPEAAAILDVQLLLLDDQYFLDEVQRKLLDHRVSLEEVIQKVAEEAASQLSKAEDSYLRERARDVRDIGRRVIRQLRGMEQACTIEGDAEEMVLVAEELAPSITWHLDRHRVKGFVTERGGKTSHAAILARSLGVPLVTGVVDAMHKLSLGAPVLVDGFRGEVVLHPKKGEVEKRRKQVAAALLTSKDERELARLPAVTRDGQSVKLLANVSNEADVDEAAAVNADGIGLFRTELYFLLGDRFPDEDEQLLHYRAAVEKMAPKPVTIRTLDLGGDKYSPTSVAEREPNPYLGWRAIRVSLRQPDVFKEQLRAILRASAVGPVRIMLPLISNVNEVRQAKELLEEAREELRQRDVAFAEEIPFGVMVEVPSAALNADTLAREVDFLSVGTNDLIQYTLAVDRGNERVSHLYEPLDPAVLKLLEMVVQAARRHGKEVSLCGEMAAEVAYVPLLIGLGYRNFSMSPAFILQVKRTLRQLDSGLAGEVTRQALAAETADAVRALLYKAFGQ